MGIFKKALFACGQIGIMMLVRFYFAWILKYADQVSTGGDVLLEAGLVGLVFFAFRIFDGVIDPVAGIASDAWVRRGHQRRTLLWLSFAVPSVSFVLLFAPHHEMVPHMRWGIMLPGMLLFFLGYTFYSIPFWSLAEDYSGGDPRERTLLSNLLGVGMFVATAVVSVVSPPLIEARGFLDTAVIFALVSMLLTVLPIFAQPSSMATTRPRAKEGSSLRQLLQILRHRRLLAILCIFCGAQMAGTVLTLAAPFFAQTLLGGSIKDVSKILGSFILSALPFFLLTPAVARRWGWPKVVLWCSIALTVILTASTGLGRGVIGSPMTTAMVLFALGGPMIALLMGLEALAVLDCANEAGESLTGLYMGVSSFAIKALNGLASFIAGLLVSLSHRSGWQTAAIRGMGLLSGGLMGLGVLGYLLLRPRRDT